MTQLVRKTSFKIVLIKDSLKIEKEKPHCQTNVQPLLVNYSPYNIIHGILICQLEAEWFKAIDVELSDGSAVLGSNPVWDKNVS